MTHEEIERTIEFMLQHGARIDARLDQLAERHGAAIERHDKEISQLTDLVGRVAQAEMRLVERMDALAASQKDTDERLNALIVTVERYIASRNGGSPGRGKRK